MKLSFPFSHKSVFRLSTEGVSMAMIEAEEAVTKEEVQQALSGRTICIFVSPFCFIFLIRKRHCPFIFAFHLMWKFSW